MRKLLIISLLFISQAKAQSISASLLSSGGDLFKANGMQLEWTLGDLSIQAHHNFTEGYLQGSSSHRSGQNEITNAANKVSYQIFPNPFYDGINLNISNHNANTNMLVFDVLGKVVYGSKNLESNNYISLSHLQAGIYFISIYDNDTKIGTAKLSKL